MTTRRGFFGALALVLIAPRNAPAQPSAKFHRVGILHGRFPGDANVAAFRQGMDELGYRQGSSAHFEVRWAEGRPERLPALASELVAQKVDVIFTATTTGALAAKNATSTIPVVFAAVGDPVGIGLVSNLARPGGNVTGLSLMSVDVQGKILELLREVYPRIRRVAVITATTNPANALGLRSAEPAAKSLGLNLEIVNVRDAEDFPEAFSQIRKRKPEALWAQVDTLTLNHRREIAEFALKHRLPSIFGTQEFVDAGGFMSYGPSYPVMYRRAATYVDKILKGAKPSDLPVEQPTTFELVINIKTAKALGITIPQPILVRADRVIE